MEGQTAPARGHGRFLTGSTMGHVVGMTLMSAVGLMAMFLVDFADLFFIAMLGVTAATAAVGFAGTVAFANLSVALGLSIAASALVARAIGQGRQASAQRFAASSLAVSFFTGLAMALLVAGTGDRMLSVLGAEGEALELAHGYLMRLVLGFPLLSMAITCSFILRAIGDPRRAMYVTLTTAATNAVLDPVFIFGLDMGIEGAATATVCANVLSLAIGLHGLHVRHGFLERPTVDRVAGDLRPIFAIALPAIATQLATPFAIAYMTRITAAFGPEVVAGGAIINRLIPVAFGIVFSLSGAVGPIVGQNFGADQLDRVRQTLNDALKFSTAYTLGVSLVLLLAARYIPGIFNATGETAEIVTFYCRFVAVSWAFAGAQFVAQAAFNNLGRPHWSMAFNWGKSTLGTIPFLHAGAALGGAKGALLGMGVGTVVSGLAAALTCYWLVGRLAARPETGRAGGMRHVG